MFRNDKKPTNQHLQANANLTKKYSSIKINKWDKTKKKYTLCRTQIHQ